MTAAPLGTRLVLADDHPIVLRGLKSLIQSDRRYDVLAACSNGLEALDAIRAHRPDLAVLDISMPGLNGLQVLEHVQSELLQTRVVFLTASASDESIARAVTLGAWALLLKDAASDQLLEALAAVVSGSRWFPPDVVDAAIRRVAARRSEGDRIVGSLTQRERQLILLVMEGLSNKEIARRFRLTEGTVKIHLHNIYQKLGVTNRTAMAALALAHLDRFKS
jgi:two-component system nitrate/nitrite response regulator NarL